MINKLSEVAHQNAINKGFFETEPNLGQMLCLIHAEVSEALEADREGKYVNSKITNILEIPGDEAFTMAFKLHVKDSFEDELADVMIRVLDLAGFKKIDLESHILAKMRYNATRPHKHGKKY